LPPFVSIAYLHVTKYQTEVNLLKREKERAIISEQRVALFFFQIGRKARLVFLKFESFSKTQRKMAEVRLFISKEICRLFPSFCSSFFRPPNYRRAILTLIRRPRDYS